MSLINSVGRASLATPAGAIARHDIPGCFFRQLRYAASDDVDGSPIRQC